jgi:hypothetical protein
MIVLCAYLADGEEFVKVYDYPVDKHEVLAEFLALPAGIPTRDTIKPRIPTH